MISRSSCSRCRRATDKPFKYPAIFSRAAVTVITKTDLLPYVRFDIERATDQILSLNPDARILTTSTYTGRGMGACVPVPRRAARREVTRSDRGARAVMKLPFESPEPVLALGGSPSGRSVHGGRAGGVPLATGG